LLNDVDVAPLDPRRFEAVLDPGACRGFARRLEQAAERLEGRRLWHVNSTKEGGGVAEMLHFLLGYLTGAGVDARWVVLDGDERFFQVTKRIHNLLHGQPGDRDDLGDPERRGYEQTLGEAFERVRRLVDPGDVVLLHDPQTAGLAPSLKRLGAGVVWSCHVGVDRPNRLARAAWAFLRPYVQQADAHVFSRRAYAWEGLGREKLAVMPPCIDAFAPKNQPMDGERVAAILEAAGIVDAGDAGGGDPAFHRLDGSRARVRRRAELVQDHALPASAPIVLQVSRWDRLKDPTGVLQGFARHVADGLGAHLVLAGPAADSVSDDPEGEEVLRQVRDAWAALPASHRARVHLACLPMDDLEENGAIVNALQRRADVLVQKSLAEGFGLTVTEAMWKSRPVVASGVGGIQDQIDHEVNGLLVDDPGDLAAFGRAVESLLEDRDGAMRMGAEAHRRVREDYLAPRRLIRELDLVERVAACGRPWSASGPATSPRAASRSASGPTAASVARHDPDAA
jgi:trehalose synthase